MLRSSDRAGEQQFCRVCVQLQSVGGHPLADVKDAALDRVDRRMTPFRRDGSAGAKFQHDRYITSHLAAKNRR